MPNAIRTRDIIAHLLTAPSTYENIGEVISFDGPGGKASIIDTTNLLRPSRKSFLVFLTKEASMTQLRAAIPGRRLADARIAQTLVTMKITFVDPSTAQFRPMSWNTKSAARRIARSSSR